MDDESQIIIGTGKWYNSGRINVSDNIKKESPYKNAQDLIVSLNQETGELCMKPLKY